jgi:hypothetical protein
VEILLGRELFFLCDPRFIVILERESSGIGKNRLELIRLIRAELFKRNSYAAKRRKKAIAKLGERVKLKRQSHHRRTSAAEVTMPRRSGRRFGVPRRGDHRNQTGAT